LTAIEHDFERARQPERSGVMPETLRVILAEHVHRSGRGGADPVFGRTPSQPFTPTHTSKR